MIEFMVIGAPRSGTTWAANWLTTCTTLCMHDPLASIHYQDWDEIKSSKMLGIADTGISFFYKWLNTHPARKVILHRDKNEIAKSLGIPEFSDMTCHLDDVKGMHVYWDQLFKTPKEIYEFLLQREFDAERHFHLKHIKMQPSSRDMVIDKVVMKKIMQEIKESEHV